MPDEPFAIAAHPCPSCGALVTWEQSHACLVTATTDAEGFTEGRCTACEGEAERGPSGAWWHIDPYSCGRLNARFRPERWSR